MNRVNRISYKSMAAVEIQKYTTANLCISNGHPLQVFKNFRKIHFHYLCDQNTDSINYTSPQKKQNKTKQQRHPWSQHSPDYNRYNTFRKIYPLCRPIKLSYMDKSHMSHRGQLNEHFCKTKNRISQMRLQI